MQLRNASEIGDRRYATVHAAARQQRCIVTPHTRIKRMLTLVPTEMRRVSHSRADEVVEHGRRYFQRLCRHTARLFNSVMEAECQTV